MNQIKTISIIQRILKITSQEYRLIFFKLLLGIIFNSLLEIVGLAALIPLLASVLRSGFIQENGYLSWIYQILGFQSERAFIVLLASLILIFIVFKNFYGIWIQRKQALFGWNLHEDLSQKMFKNIYSRGYLFFTGNNSNQILNKVNSVPQQFAQQLLVSVFQLLNELVILGLIVISLIAYDFIILGLLAGVIIPVFMVFYKLNKKRISGYGNQLNLLLPEMSKPVFEVVFGYVDVAVNGIFNSFLKTYITKIRQAKRLRVTLLVIQSVPNRLIESAVILAVLLMLLYGVFVLKSSESVLELLTIFGLAAYRTIPSVNRLMLALVNIKNFEYTLNVIEEFSGGANEGQLVYQPLSFDRNLKLENISFKYPDTDKEIIHDFSLNIEKGTSLGIMGTSGSGKTTLMNIMLGFIEPTSGRLVVDDVPINSDNLSSWQLNCGYVRQDVFLVDGTISDNVAFGIDSSEVDESRLMQALEMAQLQDLVKSLPEGVNSTLGERGARISGGQRQRIGIARALYHGAEILFFDEATSALDSKTEEEITEAIRSLQQQKLTMVIIAHRESTLKYCDKIINL